MNVYGPEILPAVFPPAWAGGWGEDRKGVFAEIVVNAIAMEMRWIPPGSFKIGSPGDEVGRFDDEGPRHDVKLTQGYWLGATPCTQAQWKAVVGKTPSHFKGADRPVECVTWEDCQEFCAAMNELLPGLWPRLPGEAEWEYACRAGTQSAFGDGSACTVPEGADPALDRLGWYRENSGGETHPVGRKEANAWGLYDLHGNVWEWCQDWYGKYGREVQTDTTAPESGDFRVLRGGSWRSSGRGCRAAYRDGNLPGSRNLDRGFRLAAGRLPEQRERSERGGAEGAAAPQESQIGC